MQVFQSPAWDRGMGKYTLELITEISKIAKKNNLSIDGLLSNRMAKPKGFDDIVKKQLKNIKITTLDLLEDKIGDKEILIHNKSVIDDYISEKFNHQNLSHIIYFVPSPMQGYICSPLPSNRPDLCKVVLVHDLIPLAFHELYLQSNITREEYLSRIKELLRADLYVTNSKTTANDLSTYLHINKERIHSINGGPANHATTQKPYPIKSPFILMPTGNDLRKNNERAVRAFEQFNKRENYKYRLIITSYFKDYQIEQLKGLSKNLEFTGNIKGDQLSYLFKECEAVLFPSEYEGLGMPILEALEYNKPVACSDIAVFKEISRDAFVYFNPYVLSEIVYALKEAIEKYTINKKEYENILKRFSWLNTAKNFINALDKITPARLIKKQKVAVFAPDSSGYSNAGKFCLDAHAELSRNADLFYYLSPFRDNKELRINYLPYIANVATIQKGMGYAPNKFDITFFHLDSSEGSANVLFASLASKGESYVFLHDINLRPVWQRMLEVGLINKERYDLERNISRDLGEKKSMTFLGSLINSQQNIVVFDKYQEAILNKYKNKLKASTNIMYFPRPISALPYGHSTNKKSVAYLCMSEIRSMGSLSDFQINNIISRIKMLIFDVKDSEYNLILEVMKYGVIPCIPKFLARRLQIPQECYVEYEKNIDLSLLIALGDNIKEDSIRNFIDNRFSYEDLTSKIAKISK